MHRHVFTIMLLFALGIGCAFAQLYGQHALNWTSPSTTITPNLAARASASASTTFSCDQNSPCSNSACCAKSGYCGYGPTYCGTDGQSPNDACWSNCTATAECGEWAAISGQACPLNVCCSQYGFCGTTSDFCGTKCQSNCDQPPSGAPAGNVQTRIIGYYESWANSKQCMGMGINQIPVESLTHLNYAFAYISPGTFEVGPMPGTQDSTFSDITNLKQRNGALIVGISIGGWSFNDNDTSTQNVFGDMVSSAANRKLFISNLLAFMQHYGFDAVDFDWEYPGAPDRQPDQADSTLDTPNYALLLQELRAASDSEPNPLYISFTAPTSYWYLRWFDISEMAAVADYINFMTYDLHGVWDADDPVGSQVLAHTNLTEISQALDLLWRNGIDPSVVNLGLAFYARTFQLTDPACTSPGCPFAAGGLSGACTATSGILSYREVTDLLSSRSVTPTYDSSAGVKYFSWGGDQWASYDDEQTFQQKIRYANNQGLGGLFIWALDQDNNNLDALRGVLYPQDLQVTSALADDVSYWQNQLPGACETTACGASCPSGTIQLTTVACPSGGNRPQRLCCPLASVPNAADCRWRGGPGLCDGQCHGGEVAVASSKNGGNGHCHDGLQFFCCPVPEASNSRGLDCGWKDHCSADQELMTFAGTFLEDIIPVASFGGLVGAALAEALEGIDIAQEKQYCCSSTEAAEWKDCYWAGGPHRGLSSCDDNHCRTGIEVELTTSFFGEGETCAPQLGRQRAFCCTPSSGQSLFLPVPLDELFPNPPPIDSADPVFNLQVDDTWGTGVPSGQDDPDDASFGMVVITSPAEVQVSLDRRDGSPWEMFDCLNHTHEDAQTVRMVCLDLSEGTSCDDIHRGHGAPGTIIALPEGCGPGRYAVVKSLKESRNQSLPYHLLRRDMQGAGPVHDLTFDHDFSRVPRDFGDSQMRIDVSNEVGYWSKVVDRPGRTKMKREDLAEFNRSPKRWLEDEWRDAYHFSSLSREDLHKRWFGEDALAWLANLVGTGQAQITEELHHTVNEDLSIILIDQQFGPCPVGPAMAEAHVRASIDAHVEVDTTFGMTIITTLAFPPDLSNSYLYFKNKGQVTATFNLLAVATLSYSSGDVKLIGLDDFPGATFRVPGIVTVGPNLAVYGAVDAVLTLSGQFSVKSTLASWEIQQTYPPTAENPAKALVAPDQDGTQQLGTPYFDASVTASGEVTLHLKPTVTFGIVFDSRWQVDACSVSLVLDGYSIFHTGASWSLNDDNSCPFSWGIDVGANVYVQAQAPSAFNWGGTQQVTIPTPGRKQVAGSTCEAAQADDPLRRSARESALAFGNTSNATLSLDGTQLTLPMVSSRLGGESWPGVYHGGLQPRDTFSLGPLITIPDSFLNCPQNDSDGCPLCSDASPVGASKRQSAPTENGPSCPWFAGVSPADDYCTDSPDDSTTDDRATGSIKFMKFSWSPKNPADGFRYSFYPACSPNNLNSLRQVSRFWLPKRASKAQCTPEMVKYPKDNGVFAVQGTAIAKKFATDHVFEVHLIKDFLEWLCGTTMQQSYSGTGTIPFPRGWQQPNSNWCNDVFGSGDGTGYLFDLSPGDNDPDNWVTNTADYLGGDANTRMLAILYNDVNGLKKEWTSGRKVNTGGYSPQALVDLVLHSAGVFSYLNNAVIQTMWTTPSNNIEALCARFDAVFWTSGHQASGNALVRPPMPAGVTNWGLRTLWCYWIDRHEEKVESLVGPWLDTAKVILKGGPGMGGSSNVVPNFVSTQMAAGGLASEAKMRFPRDPNFDTIATPGTPGSATTRTSKYLMWGANGLGRLGL